MKRGTLSGRFNAEGILCALCVLRGRFFGYGWPRCVSVATDAVATGLPAGGARASVKGMRWTRRRFCLLAGGAAALALPAAAQGPREPRSYYGGLRVGIASQCFARLPLEQAAAKTTALGIKYLELSPAHAALQELDTAQLRACALSCSMPG